MLKRRLNFFWQRFTQMWFPDICMICNKLGISYSLQICPTCYLNLPWCENYCIACAKFIVKGLRQCIKCSKRSLKKIDKIVCAFDYYNPVTRYILRMKYRGDLISCMLLANMLVDAILIAYKNKKLPDVLIPVPLHTSKFEQRGYNQAEFIAEFVSDKLNIPIDKEIAIRKHYYGSQANKSLYERRINVEDCFFVTKNKYKYAVIIDDVFTTGSTVYSLAKELYLSGIKEVDAWVLAKAVYCKGI